MIDGIVTATGWTLLHFIWQGAVLGALFFSAMTLMRSASANARYWVGMLCLGAMFGAAVATFRICYDPGLVGGIAGLGLPGVPSAGGVIGVTGVWEGIGQRVEGWLPWAVLAWLAGVVLISASLMIDYLRIRRLSVHGVRPLQPEVQSVADRLVDSLRLQFAVRVLESGLVAVPMVIGWLRPVILVPSSAVMGLSPRQLELILSHELAHVRRLDYLFNLLQIAVETLLFYHPVVRAVSIRVRLERENCCDDLVVAQSGDSIAYARALTEVEGLRCSSGMQLTMAATGGHLRGRVRRLVATPSEQRGAVDWAGGLVMLVISIGVALSGASWVSDSSVDQAPVTAGTAPVPEAAVRQVAPETAGREVSKGSAAPPAGGDEDSRPMAIAPGVPGEHALESTGTSPPSRLARDEVKGTGSERRAPVIGGARQQSTEAPASPKAVAAGGEPAAAPEPPMADATNPAELSSPAGLAATPAPEDDAVVVASQKISGGKLLEFRQPSYPRRARIKGMIGVVSVVFDVAEDGRMENVAIVDSTARIFERPVLKALKKWRYQPFLLDGEPARARVTHTFQFELEADQVARTEGSGRCEKVTGSRLCQPRAAYEGPGAIIVYNSSLD
jgi:bla regulator protein BlaR1